MNKKAGYAVIILGLGIVCRQIPPLKQYAEQFGILYFGFTILLAILAFLIIPSEGWRASTSSFVRRSDPDTSQIAVNHIMNLASQGDVRATKDLLQLWILTPDTFDIKNNSNFADLLEEIFLSPKTPNELRKEIWKNKERTVYIHEHYTREERVREVEGYGDYEGYSERYIDVEHHLDPCSFFDYITRYRSLDEVIKILRGNN